MKNILLVFEHGIEFDFVRVVLTTLGFNTLSLHKNPDVRAKIKKRFPDLVITSSLASKDEIVNELITARAQAGGPKFLWIGSSLQKQKLTEAQTKMIDASLPTPIQPEKLIEQVCLLMGIPPQDYVKKYHEIQSKNAQGGDKSIIFVSDKERKKRYADALTRVENLDRVLSVKDIAKNQPPVNSSPDLLDKKKNFVKALFNKK